MAYAAGSALGGVLRHRCSGAAAQLIGAGFPWGTLIVNIPARSRSAFSSPTPAPTGACWSPPRRASSYGGICGGYTTFSSFSLQALNLIRDAQYLHAGANILSSVLLCMLAVWLGHVAAAQLNESPGVNQPVVENPFVAPSTIDQDHGHRRQPRSEH
jgi:CrcB protein